MAERKTTKEILVYPEGHENAGQPTGEVKFKFSDDSVETFTLANVSDAMIRRLALHGASQKIGDSYADAASETDPLAFAKESVKETIAQLYAKDKGGLDTWRVGGGGGARTNDLAVATARATGQTLEDSIELVDAMSDDDKKAWRKKPKIASALAAIAAEKAIAKAKKLAEAAEKEDKDAAAAGAPATA